MRHSQDPWAPRRQGPAAPSPQAPAIWEAQHPRRGPTQARQGPRFGLPDVILLVVLGLGLYLCYAAFNELLTALDLVTSRIGAADAGDITGQMKDTFTRMAILFALGGSFSAVCFNVLRWRWDPPSGRRSGHGARMF